MPRYTPTNFILNDLEAFTPGLCRAERRGFDTKPLSGTFYLPLYPLTLLFCPLVFRTRNWAVETGRIREKKLLVGFKNKLKEKVIFKTPTEFLKKDKIDNFCPSCNIVPINFNSLLLQNILE